MNKYIKIDVYNTTNQVSYTIGDKPPVFTCDKEEWDHYYTLLNRVIDLTEGSCVDGEELSTLVLGINNYGFYKYQSGYTDCERDRE